MRVSEIKVGFGIKFICFEAGNRSFPRKIDRKYYFLIDGDPFVRWTLEYII